MIKDLRETSAITEESFRNLLTTVEKFCGQATRELERVAPRPQLLAAPPAAPPPPPPRASSRRNYRAWVASVLVAAGIVVAGFLLWPSKQVEPAGATAAPSAESAAPNVAAPDRATPVESNKPKTPRSQNTPAVAPSRSEAAAGAAAESGSPEANSEPMHIDLEAREPTWVSITDVDGNSLMARVLEPNETRSFELTKGATLRTGNAGRAHPPFQRQGRGTPGSERQGSRHRI